MEGSTLSLSPSDQVIVRAALRGHGEGPNPSRSRVCVQPPPYICVRRMGKSSLGSMWFLGRMSLRVSIAIETPASLSVSMYIDLGGVTRD